MSRLLEKLGSLGDNHEVIANLDGIKFDVITNIINMMSTETKKPVIIDDYVISQPVFDLSFFIHITLNGLFKSEKNAIKEEEIKTLRLKWLVHKSDLSQLKKLKQKVEVAIIYDNRNSNFLITDGHSSHYVDAYDDNLPKAPLELEQLIIGSCIYKPSLKDIKNYLGKSKYVFFDLFGDQLEQIEVSGTGPYTFTTASIIALQKKTPSRRLRSVKFPWFVGEDNLVIKIAQDDKKDFWLLTESELVRGVKAKTFEKLNQ